jgi:hypothetical protein
MEPIDPEPRRTLFVNAAESWLLDPQHVPYAMTTPPHIPALPPQHHPCSKPYEPRFPEPVPEEQPGWWARLWLLRARRG